MIDFNVPQRAKTPEEKQFDELNEKYEALFGFPYHFAIGINLPTWEEAISDIRRRIAENDPQPPPDYDPNYVY